MNFLVYNRNFYRTKDKSNQKEEANFLQKLHGGSYRKYSGGSEFDWSETWIDINSHKK